MRYYTVEYGLYTSLPLVERAEGQLKPIAILLGDFTDDNEATHAAAQKFNARPIRINCLASDDRRWLVLNAFEYDSLIQEVA